MRTDIFPIHPSFPACIDGQYLDDLPFSSVVLESRGRTSRCTATTPWNLRPINHHLPIPPETHLSITISQSKERSRLPPHIRRWSRRRRPSTPHNRSQTERKIEHRHTRAHQNLQISKPRCHHAPEAARDDRGWSWSMPAPGSCATIQGERI